MGVAAPGNVIAGRYRVDRLLGRGGMGSVWAATHLVTHKSVALKLIDDPGRPNTRRRFEREARAASAALHPNIVAVHDVFEAEDGTPVMVMDLLVGEPLDYRLVREGRLPLAEAASILVPVVSAVGSVHARGVVHRDLKPANIFLAEEGGRVVVKVLDFGLAKLSSTERAIGEPAALTTTGAMMGTPYYMAPEQCAGEREIDHRVDVWALGVILYECLAGRRPITADNLGQVIKKVLIDGVPPLEDAVQGLPDEIYALVRRMLARERDARPGDLREVGEVLAHFAGEGVAAPPFGPPAPMLSEPDTPPPDAVKRAIPVRPAADSRAETAFQSGSGELPSTREDRPPVSARVERGIAGLAVGVAVVAGVALFLSRAGEAPGPRGHADAVATIAPMPVAPPAVDEAAPEKPPAPSVASASAADLGLPSAASASAPPAVAPAAPVKRRAAAPSPAPPAAPPAVASAKVEAPPPPAASSAPAPPRRGVIRDPRF
jgi:serine/threonine-protein kinase